MSRQALVGPGVRGGWSGLEVLVGDRFPAVRTVPAGAQATAEDVAVWAPLFAEITLLAPGTLIDGSGAPWWWRWYRRSLLSGSVVGLAAGV